MAIVVSNLTNGGATDNNVSNINTASISPTNGSLVIITIWWKKTIASDNVPTVSGAGSGWVQINNIDNNDGTSHRGTVMYRDLQSVWSSGAITIDFGGIAQDNMNWSIDQFTGTDSTGTHGSGAIVQNVTKGTTSANTSSFAITLAAFGSSNNVAYGGFREGGVGAITVGSGFTSLATPGNTGTIYNTEYKLNDTNVNWSYPAVTAVQVGMAVEVKAAAAAQYYSSLSTLGVS